MLFYITIFIIIGILIYCLFLFFGLSLLKAGKEMDKVDFQIRENYIKELEKTGEIPVEKIKEMERENKKTLL